MDVGKAAAWACPFGRGTHPPTGKEAGRANSTTSLLPSDRLPRPSIGRPQSQTQREGKKPTATVPYNLTSGVPSRVERLDGGFEGASGECVTRDNTAL